MKKYLFLLCAISSLAAHEMVVNSDLVDYDGKTLHLKANVSIQTEIGHFTADSVDWEEQSDFLSLEGQVHCLLKDGTALSCERAKCDLTSGQIKLEGGDKEVVLNDLLHGRFCLQAKAMDLQLGTDKNSLKKHVLHLALEGCVKFQYQNEMTVVADKAVYQRDADASQNEPLYGILKLTGLCQYSNPLGDTISADEVALDFVKKQTSIAAPIGVFCVHHLGNAEKLHFSAGRLFWDRADKKIELREKVKAELPEIGQFSVEEEISLVYRMVNGKRELKRLECQGETRLAVEDAKKKYSCTFVCPGKVTVDREKQKISMCRSDQGSQVFFQDGLAKISADLVNLHFSHDEKTVLQQVLLEGRVQLVNRLTQFLDGENPMQYALADSIEYLPVSKELNLLSSGKQRVLFQDNVNHIQISAPALRIKRTTPAQKGYIQGVGDVRFSFAKAEAEMLKNAFFEGA